MGTHQLPQDVCGQHNSHTVVVALIVMVPLNQNPTLKYMNTRTVENKQMTYKQDLKSHLLNLSDLTVVNIYKIFNTLENI